MQDSLVSLRAHEIGGDEREAINAKYIAELLAKHWGFWYTIASNSEGIKDFASKYKALTEEDRLDIVSKVNKVLEYINDEPKSFSWKCRSMIGDKKRWYRPVETTETVAGFGIWRLREIFHEEK